MGITAARVLQSLNGKNQAIVLSAAGTKTFNPFAPFITTAVVQGAGIHRFIGSFGPGITTSFHKDSQRYSVP